MDYYSFFHLKNIIFQANVRILTDGKLLKTSGGIGKEKHLYKVADKLGMTKNQVKTARTDKSDSINMSALEVFSEWFADQKDKREAFDKFYIALCEAGQSSLTNLICYVDENTESPISHTTNV